MQTANIRKDQMVLLLDKTDFKIKTASSNWNTLQIMDRATSQQIKMETENLKHHKTSRPNKNPQSTLPETAEYILLLYVKEHSIVYTIS